MINSSNFQKIKVYNLSDNYYLDTHNQSIKPLLCVNTKARRLIFSMHFMHPCITWNGITEMSFLGENKT